LELAHVVAYSHPGEYYILVFKQSDKVVWQAGVHEPEQKNFIGNSKLQQRHPAGVALSETRLAFGIKTNNIMF